MRCTLGVVSHGRSSVAHGSGQGSTSLCACYSGSSPRSRIPQSPRERQSAAISHSGGERELHELFQPSMSGQHRQPDLKTTKQATAGAAAVVVVVVVVVADDGQIVETIAMAVAVAVVEAEMRPPKARVRFAPWSLPSYRRNRRLHRSQRETLLAIFIKIMDSAISTITEYLQVEYLR